MTDVSFVFTNPSHHVEMMVPVARELRRRGLVCQLVSLAELRGLDTPADLDLPVRKAVPYNFRRRPQVGASIGHPSGKNFWIRDLAQRAVSLALLPRVRSLIGNSRAIVIPNDCVFPYRGLVESLDAPVVLMQEGIRFDFPNGDDYGTCGVAAICAWGAGSAELFIKRGVASEIVQVTGAPRLDTLSPEGFAERGGELLAKLGLRHRPVVFLSNPIEQQGFGTPADRLALFEQFLAEAAPVLRDRDLALLVKNHRSEDPADYVAIGKRSAVADRVHVPADVPLFVALAASAAGVVLTSTVGLEALVFGLSLGALEIRGHGYGFEYVSHGAAVGLAPGTVAKGLAEMLDTSDARRAAGQAFIERHLHARGAATRHVADVVERVSAPG